jgi:hypothetical protein
MLLRRSLPSWAPRALLALLASPAFLAACPSSNSPGDAPKGALVVGVQSEDFGGIIDSVHIVATIDGATASDETITVGTKNPTALPTEITLAGEPGAKVEVTVTGTTTQAATRGLTSGSAPANDVVLRRAVTSLVEVTNAPDSKKLLRMQLETRCSTFSAPGNTLPIAPTCDAPQTCSAGKCIDDGVGVAQLETYEADWATSPPDVCRPANHGAPELYAGTGQTDYAPLNDGQTLQLERGPQGGHHIWIAARMKNLRQSGSRTTLTAKLVADPNSPVAPAAYVFTFDPNEGNFCKL